MQRLGSLFVQALQGKWHFLWIACIRRYGIWKHP